MLSHNTRLKKSQEKQKRHERDRTKYLDVFDERVIIIADVIDYATIEKCYAHDERHLLDIELSLFLLF
jgi:hypothetical protein